MYCEGLTSNSSLPRVLSESREFFFIFMYTCFINQKVYLMQKRQSLVKNFTPGSFYSNSRSVLEAFLFYFVFMFRKLFRYFRWIWKVLRKEADRLTYRTHLMFCNLLHFFWRQDSVKIYEVQVPLNIFDLVCSLKLYSNISEWNLVTPTKCIFYSDEVSFFQ